VQPTKIEKVDEAWGSHKKPKSQPRKYEILYDYNGRPVGQRRVEERARSQVAPGGPKRSASKLEALVQDLENYPEPRASPAEVQAAPEEPKVAALPDWIMNPFKDLFAPEVEEEEAKLEEPPAEPLERKPKDVLVRSKSRVNKSGERPLKKPTQASVLNLRKARLNLLVGSVKASAMKDLSDPLLMSKELTDLMQKRKTSNSKSRRLPYKPTPVTVSAFEKQNVMQPQIINQALFIQTSAKKLA
jgi:hypothetical protein